MYILNPMFFCWDSPLLNGLPFENQGNASQGNLQLSDIAFLASS